MHDFVLVYTQYMQVCTLKIRTYEYIRVCTSMCQNKPGSYKKHSSCTTGQAVTVCQWLWSWTVWLINKSAEQALIFTLHHDVLHISGLHINNSKSFIPVFLCLLPGVYCLVLPHRAQLFTHHHLQPSPQSLVLSQTAEGLGKSASADSLRISKGIGVLVWLWPTGREPVEAVPAWVWRTLEWHTRLETVLGLPQAQS